MKAPFPWYGGKRRVAHIVWDRFGDVANYVEPFAGSLAVLLERPHEPRCETVNDLDCMVANFWRALKANAQELHEWADWPVNEADLHARHKWLSNLPGFRERMLTEPDYYDPKIAGWWVWGLSMWIGGGWCSHISRDRGDGTSRRGRPYLTSPGHGMHRKRPIMKRGGVGVQRVRPSMTSNGVHRSIPDLGGDAGAYGRGVHASGRESSLMDYFQALAARLRRVRVCCGDWSRVLGFSPTTAIGKTAVFLDPPYAADRDPELYRMDDMAISGAVRDWAIANGENPDMRIALCGYQGEHEMPENWTVHAWSTNGGYGNQTKRKDTRAKLNRTRERIWFSPHCLQPNQKELFV